jgi:glycosyltransferase involved in cell wall biosynthesis
MTDEKEISVIIPVYNSATCIQKLVTDVHGILSSETNSFEIIIVDDDSKDESWKNIKKICAQFSKVKAFSLSKNFGQHKATLCGFYHANGKYVITMDDDFEHDPKDVLTLYHQLKNSHSDVVYAMPKNIKKSLIRRATTKFYKFISKVENPYAGVGSSFRALKKDLVSKIVSHQNHLFFIDELILWYTASIDVCELNFNPSQKISGYSYSKLFSLSSNVLMISTTMPLKLVKTLGISMSFISFLIGTFYFLKKIIFKSPAGYTSIIVSVLFSAGLILFCLGIIGEYLGNVLMMQNNKPAFYIREKI